MSQLTFEPTAPLRIQTFGGFRLWRDEIEIAATAWSREKALHLFQFLLTRQRHAPRLHKEQIINQLWPELDPAEGDRDFKVALHASNKVLEPERQARREPRFIQRHDLTYGLAMELIWLDAVAFETLLAQGNQVIATAPDQAIVAYQQALSLYQGDYLPERRYEDWSSAERERLQVLALGTMTNLARLYLSRSPLETIRLTQQALAIDPVWESAYRLQMAAYMAQGNRPLALRTYQQCRQVLADELGLEPLPETQALAQQITGLSRS
jgi:two-component SAPR family response regulator